jgi:hypothetical protein
MTLSSGWQASTRRRNFVASSNFKSISAVRLTATPRCAGGQISALHCQEISAELTFRNQVSNQLSSRAKPGVVPSSRFSLEPTDRTHSRGGARLVVERGSTAELPMPTRFTRRQLAIAGVSALRASATAAPSGARPSDGAAAGRVALWTSSATSLCSASPIIRSYPNRPTPMTPWWMP